ncbi:hypothetical protein [Winogradskyella psychrotolerans]|uniref:hypothetical protein n=1 Tax=Winogradskyella psychrotolerans TaxID=1344585 RepID=UPI001C075081|nr:hypothetical protein [Winogradskyella psychrotolerans]MBU2927114.1 hypothetical protein [Winogradskyella psychrotolerans]
MIKFFRKIRQRLLTENKFSKYLLYAIGEIFLVVLGILIALNINNRNELEKNKKSVVSSLKEIQSNLLDDIKLSQDVLESYLIDDSIQKKIFDFKNPATINDYKNKKITEIGNYYIDFVINKNGYENLMRQIDVMPKNYTPILKDLKNLYVSLNSTINVYNERVRSTVYSNVDFKYSQDWEIYKRKHKQISNEEANYFANDNRYKKYIIKYMNDSENLFGESMRYRIKAIETYRKIDSLLNIKKSELPLHLLAKVNVNELKGFLGIYKFEGERDILNKLYVKNNILYFDFSDSEFNYIETLRNYKINDTLYLNEGGVWKFNRDSLGRIGIEYRGNPIRLTKIR